MRFLNVSPLHLSLSCSRGPLRGRLTRYGTVDCSLILSG
jgi:hypothetical protein